MGSGATKYNYENLLGYWHLGFVWLVCPVDIDDGGHECSPKIDLVTDKYYEEEIQYQGKIDKIKNAKNLAAPLVWEVTDTGIKVNYPKELQNISGVVNFYCPSDNSKDFSVKIQPEFGNIQYIPTQNAAAGRYRIQFDWKSGEMGYWNEGIVNL